MGHADAVGRGFRGRGATSFQKSGQTGYFVTPTRALIMALIGASVGCAHGRSGSAHAESPPRPLSVRVDVRHEGGCSQGWQFTRMEGTLAWTGEALVARGTLHSASGGDDRPSTDGPPVPIECTWLDSRFVVEDVDDARSAPATSWGCGRWDLGGGARFWFRCNPGVEPGEVLCQLHGDAPSVLAGLVGDDDVLRLVPGATYEGEGDDGGTSHRMVLPRE